MVFRSLNCTHSPYTSMATTCLSVFSIGYIQPTLTVLDGHPFKGLDGLVNLYHITNSSLFANISRFMPYNGLKSISVGMFDGMSLLQYL